MDFSKITSKVLENTFTHVEGEENNYRRLIDQEELPIAKRLQEIENEIKENIKNAEMEVEEDLIKKLEKLAMNDNGSEDSQSESDDTDESTDANDSEQLEEEDYDSDS